MREATKPVRLPVSAHTKLVHLHKQIDGNMDLSKLLKLAVEEYVAIHGPVLIKNLGPKNI